jgi:hypothetical protein
MEFHMTHDEALDAITGCARTVAVLSYQEAIEGYLQLRGMWPTQGIEAGTGETRQGLDPKDESPVAASHAPNSGGLHD